MRWRWEHGPITERDHILWKDQPQSNWYWRILRVTSLERSTK